MSTTKTARRKVLIIGWDGADWQHIDPLLEKGYLPTLKGLIERGARGHLSTLHPILSPMLWTSIATGKRPAKHGIHGFVEPDPDQKAVRPVSSTSRKVKAFWNILCQSGLSQHIVGWWPSHPAERIEGSMVSNLFQKCPQPGKPWPERPRAVHPERLRETLEALRVRPDELTGDAILPFVPRAREVDQEKDRRLAMLAKLIAETSTVHATTTHLMEHEPWDVTAVYYDAVDHFCHGFMAYHPPKLPQVSTRDFELYSEVVTGCYRFLDMTLERLLALAGPDALVFLLSDHGFLSDHRRPRSTPRIPAGPAVWHREQGIIVVSGPGVRKEEIQGATLLDLTPTLLAALGLPVGQDMDGKVLVQVFEEPPEIERIDTWETVEGNTGEHDPDERQDPVEAAEALQQLIELGYVEAPGEDAQKAMGRAARELRYNLTQAELDAGRAVEALALADLLVEEYPDESRFFVLRIRCVVATGDAEGALALFDPLLEVRKRERKRLEEEEAAAREKRKEARAKAIAKREAAKEAAAAAAKNAADATPDAEAATDDAATDDAATDDAATDDAATDDAATAGTRAASVPTGAAVDEPGDAASKAAAPGEPGDDPAGDDAAAGPDATGEADGAGEDDEAPKELPRWVLERRAAAHASKTGLEMLRASLELAAGRSAEALARLEALRATAAEAAEGGDPPAIKGLDVALGRALLAAERHQDAAEALARAIAYDRDDVGAHEGLAEALLALDRPDEAVEVSLDAVALNYHAPWPHFRLAQALTALAIYPAAKDAYTACLALRPGWSAAIEGLAALYEGPLAEPAEAAALRARLAAAADYGLSMTDADAPGDGSERPRLLIVGWEGADWNVINPLLDAGALPHLESLIDGGTMAGLAPTWPATPAVAWTSIATGFHAPGHGVFAQFEPDPERDAAAVRRVTLRSWQRPPLWERAAARGLRSLVVGLPVTHPAETQDDRTILVSNRFARFGPEPASGASAPSDEGWVSPPVHEAALADLAVRAEEVRAEEMTAFVSDLGAAAKAKDPGLVRIARTLAVNASRHNAITALLASEPWDLAFVRYDGLSRLQHGFSRFARASSGVPEARQARFAGVVRAAHTWHDLMLGRLLELVGPDARVLLVSPYGFRTSVTDESARDAPEPPARVRHRSQGLLVARGGDFVADAREHRARVIDVAPTALAMLGLPVPNSLPGRCLQPTPRERDLDVTPWPLTGGAPDPGAPDTDAPEANAPPRDEAAAPSPTDEAIRVQPGARGRWDLMRAVALQFSGRPRKALEVLRPLFARWPEWKVVALRLAQLELRLRDFDACAETLAAARALGSGPQLELIAGTLALKQGRTEDALACVEAAERGAPPFFAFHRQIGRHYLAHARWLDAERAFRRALRIGGSRPGAEDGLGASLLWQDRHEEAEAALRRAISQRHHFPGAHFRLGCSLALQHRFEESLRALNTCVEQAPRFLRAHRWLARIHEEETGDLEQAKRHRVRARDLALARATRRRSG